MIFGIFQPILDGIKLLVKQLVQIATIQLVLYSVSPAVLLTLFLLSWVWVIPWSGQISFWYTRILFFVVLRIGAYSIIMTGYSRIRGFSKLGRLRSILQRLSFEVTLILAFFLVLGLLGSFSFDLNEVPLLDRAFLWILLWIFLSLIESNRAPFDLLEGERELISGFNIEMGSLIFVFLFLREYGITMVLIAIIGLVFLKRIFYLILVPVFFLLFIRSCFPRVRYDSLIELIWQRILPFVTIIFIEVLFCCPIGVRHVSFSLKKLEVVTTFSFGWK